MGAPAGETGSSLTINMTVQEAVRTLAAEPRFRRLVRSVAGRDADAILHAADHAESEREFQISTGRQFVDKLVSKTARSFEFTVPERLHEQPACLYISNHRDIILDTVLLNYALIANDKPVPHVAIGDNLLQTQWMLAPYRLCRAFVIRRELTGKQLYEQSKRISDFVRSAIGQGEPVWMAQRPGRTKDGADKTEPGLFRMLLMAYERVQGEGNDTLYVNPVAVSYELEPCDVYKAAALIGAQTKNAPVDRARRDAAHIMRGLIQPKGRIALTIRPPILVDNADGRSRGSNRADTIAALAQKVDQEITAGFTVWSTNFLAYDLLHHTNEFADRYAPEERESFGHYIAHRAAEILAAPSDARSALLSLYARPVTSLAGFESVQSQAAS